jgi:hypothetical protein
MYNIYCDESCHLPNDRINIMVLGGISCPSEFKDQIYRDIREIKRSYGLNSKAELKWTKVSRPKLDLYKDMIKYFFENEYLEFRAVVAKDLEYLNHAKYNNNNHDLWYWKMYFYLLDWFVKPGDSYNIFIDIKDTNGGPKVRKLQEVICNHKYDFKKDMVKQISLVNSDRSDILQLTDLLIGCLSFYHRGLHLTGSKNKRELVQLLINHVNDKINGTSPLQRKFNVFVWSPQKE